METTKIKKEIALSPTMRANFAPVQGRISNRNAFLFLFSFVFPFKAIVTQVLWFVSAIIKKVALHAFTPMSEMDYLAVKSMYNRSHVDWP